MTGEESGGLDAPQHPDLVRLLAYWQLRCGGRAFPRRADIDPLDFSYMLPRIALTEVHEAGIAETPRRYRLRVVGSWWHATAGAELTGIWIEDLPLANQRRISIEAYERMIAARRPTVTVRDAWVDERKLSYEIMHLPLSEDGQRISMILTAIGPK